ncbi:hypothetical protein FACS1894202_10530 [Clostridia bacterium]|nr:hypothetical protein FACS1894202_10530 [Clostridia bacterium]
MPKHQQERGTKLLKRDRVAMELLRYEESCRTEDDFHRLADMYDKLDANAARRWRYNERLHYDALVDWNPGDCTVIPRPIDHEWWRSLLNGNFLDTIFDCPHELSELVSSKNVIELLDALDENHKEILYYRVIRQWSPQRLAAFRGQTDRNIRKVYSKMIADFQAEMYARLGGRFERGEPLTFEQREFCVNYQAALTSGIEYQNTYEKPPRIADFTEIDDDDEVPANYNDKDDELDEFAFLKTAPDEIYYDTFHFDDDKEDV